MKVFEGIIRGFETIIHMDHLYLFYKQLLNQRAIRWQLLLKDFHPQVKHITDNNNVSADALSRFNMNGNSFGVVNWEPKTKLLYYATTMIQTPKCLS